MKIDDFPIIWLREAYKNTEGKRVFVTREQMDEYAAFLGVKVQKTQGLTLFDKVVICE